MSDDGVVIVGGGLAGQRCAQALRKRGYGGKIRMVCAESTPPYDRPPLSKKCLTSSTKEIDLSLKPDQWYVDNGVELLLGRSAVELKADSTRVILDDGSVLPYDRLLIASGSEARTLPVLNGYENVHSLRTLGDATRLGSEIGNGSHIAVIGSGFIGQEVAASSRALGDQVTIIEMMTTPLEHILGREVGRQLGRMHTDRGTTLLTGAEVERARGNGRVEELQMADGRRIECDTVVVGIGVRPAAGWLNGSGLEPDGILTDAASRTRIPGVFAAGDVTRSFDHRTGAYVRSEHWDSAVRQGRAAALSMLGETPPPPVPPSFWSDQYGKRIQYVGHAELADHAEIETGGDGETLKVRYMRGEGLVAALAIDDPRTIAAAGRTIEETHQSKTTTKGNEDELQSSS